HDLGLPAAQGGRRHHPAGRAELRLRAPARRHRGRDGRRPRGASRLDGGARRGRGAAAAPARPVPGSAPMTSSVRTGAAGASAAAPGSSPAPDEAGIPKAPPRDLLPLLLVPVVALLALPLVGSP